MLCFHPHRAAVSAWIAAGFLLAACGVDGLPAPAPAELSGPGPAPASADEAPAGAAEPVVQGGTEDYRAEQTRLAMRGITYVDGVLAIDREEARRLVDGPDAEASAAALAEGRGLIATNRRDEALAAMTRAVLLAPQDPAAYEGLGDALTVRRKYPEAAAAFRAGLARNPAGAGLHHKLGDILVRLNERVAAITEFRRALELDPSHAAARERLALQLYYTGQPAAAWREVHATEARGHDVPPQFRSLLASAYPEPAQSEEE